MTPEKQKKPNWLAIGWEFGFMNAHPCIVIAEHRLGKSNILLHSYKKEGAIEIKGYRKATDVAGEVIDKAIRIVTNAITIHLKGDCDLTETEVDIVHEFTELKKKYTDNRGLTNDRNL